LSLIWSWETILWRVKITELLIMQVLNPYKTSGRTVLSHILILKFSHSSGNPKVWGAVAGTSVTLVAQTPSLRHWRSQYGPGVSTLLRHEQILV
jgi:hypothetical protein